MRAGDSPALPTRLPSIARWFTDHPIADHPIGSERTEVSSTPPKDLEDPVGVKVVGSVALPPRRDRPRCATRMAYLKGLDRRDPKSWADAIPTRRRRQPGRRGSPGGPRNGTSAPPDAAWQARRHPLGRGPALERRRMRGGAARIPTSCGRRSGRSRRHSGRKALLRRSSSRSAWTSSSLSLCRFAFRMGFRKERTTARAPRLIV